MKISQVQIISPILHTLIILALMADFLMPKAIAAEGLNFRQLNNLYPTNFNAHILSTQKVLGPVFPDIEPTEILTEPKKVMNIVMTAYSSTVDQTDASPCITANGFNVCEHNQENVIAANFLPFGTKIRMPEIYGNRVFTVQDRMNRRYWYRGDVWLKSRESAKQFGVKYAKIEIF